MIGELKEIDDVPREEFINRDTIGSDNEGLNRVKQFFNTPRPLLPMRLPLLTSIATHSLLCSMMKSTSSVISKHSLYFVS